MSEKYEAMTVLELRRVAKEMGVKLGAGISKQGIIDKLSAAAAVAPAGDPPHTEEAAAVAAPEEDAPEAQPQPAAPVRHAAIIADEEPDEEEDDVPVLTPNPTLQGIPRTMNPRPASRPAAANPAPGASSLSTISPKAPAFTMEGARAWHNPRAYAPAGGYQRSAPGGAWGKPTQPASPGESRVYSRGPQQPQRYDPRGVQQPQRPAPAYSSSRFGPEQPEGENRPADYRPYTSDYSAPRQDYAPRTDYAAPAPQDYGAPRQPAYYHKDAAPGGSPAMADMLMTGECGDGEGVLEVHPDGYGFLRISNYRPGKNDIYVSNAQIRRFNLRTGDFVAGKTRPQREGDRSCALLYITEINGQAPEEAPKRLSFEELTALYPKRKMALMPRAGTDILLRMMDLMAPMGFGQRALVVAPARSGKTALLKRLAASIGNRYLKAQLLVLLLDERPEDVTEVREAVKGEVICSTVDETPETLAKVSELALERALRLVEQKRDVVILVDSITKMAKAYNAMAPQSARTLPGGLAAGAMNKPKRFFGSARNTREGGTLTVIALAQQEAGSALDQAIVEELRGAANLEMFIGRAAPKAALFPAVDFARSANRRPELLLSPAEMQAAEKMREMWVQDQPGLIAQMNETDDNNALLVNWQLAPAQEAPKADGQA